MKRWLFRLVQPPLTPRLEYIIDNFIQPGRQHSFTKLPSGNFNDSGLIEVQKLSAQRME